MPTSPKLSPSKVLHGFSTNPKTPVGLLGPWWIPYGPFKGAIPYCATRSPGFCLSPMECPFASSETHHARLNKLNAASTATTCSKSLL